MNPKLTPAKVTRIIDGDTIDVLLMGRPERIRLIHIDCPERGQPGYQKAKYLTRYFLQQSGNIAYLEAGKRERDPHGRLRRYVWLSPPKHFGSYQEITQKLLNAKLIAHGCAKPMFIGTDSKRYQNAMRLLYRKTLSSAL